MEFLDEDARTRFIFQSRPPSQKSPKESKLNKPFLFITLSLSSILLAYSIFFLKTEPFKSVLLWISLSFIVGPLAPCRLTGGDVQVGRGPIIEPREEVEEEEEKGEVFMEKRGFRKRSKPVRSDEIIKTMNLVTPVIETANGSLEKVKRSELWGLGDEGEKEWNEEDLVILKKQMGKNPAGKPGRWEVISEAFNGRHKVESVIKKAKELGEVKFSDGGGDYERFLKNRKPLDVRVRGESENVYGLGGGESVINKAKELGEVKCGDGCGDYERFLKNRKPLDVGESETIGGLESGESWRNDGGVGGKWSGGEDIALLNALKAFPKDVALRWEKVAAAVPGKSKAACIKRVADLKRDFRSSKANAVEADG